MGNEPIDIKAIFSEALEKQNSEERAAYLDRVCGSDADLRAKVESLLKAHQAAGDFLEAPVFGASVTLDSTAKIEGPGTMVGRYKLLQLIGEGGFGAVYMAEQEKPILRRVALKIIKLGMDTKQVIARFEAERQALAMMDHANIARVLDAGATDTGRPYFVMELVKGIPITEYCDKNNLNTRQRLDLFIDVCKAVQHAHQKGIIHRDIKPSNVMITLHDGKPVPKIIDFGIAKATQHRLTEKTFFTEYRQFIGTPEYMSPEQAEMTGLDVDTRSDIYSLGVLLYELLTGTTPFEADKLRSAAYDEIRRIIRETEPPKPSTRLSSLGDALSDVAKHRHAQPAQLCKIVRGDLDWVVMKALEKDRTRRYETANEFAMDIGRHLGDEPVVASPPSVGYRLRKFVRRNRASVTAVAAVASVVILGFVVSTTMYFRAEALRAQAEQSREKEAVARTAAERAREKEAAARTEAERQAEISQTIADFLTKDVLASVDPYRAKGQGVTIHYVLDAASENLDGKFDDEPLIEASIRQTLGSTYHSLGKYKAAEKHLERALELRQDQLGEEHPDTLTTIRNLGWLYLHQGRYGKAEPLYVKALKGRRRVLGEEHPDTLRSMRGLGAMYRVQGRYDEAEPLFVKGLEIMRRVLGEDHPDTLVFMHEAGWLYLRQGRYDEAGALFDKELKSKRRVLGEEHPDTLDSMNANAVLYIEQGRYDEAEPLLVKALEISRRVLGEAHPKVGTYTRSLAGMYSRQRRYKEAEALLVKATEIRVRKLGEENVETRRCMYSLILLYKAWGKPELAEQWRAKEHPNTLAIINNLASLYIKQDRYDEAEPLLVEALQIRRQVLGEEHPDTWDSMKELASLYRKQDRYNKAEPLLEKVLEVKCRVLGEEDKSSLRSMNNLAELYLEQDQYDKVEPLYVRILEICRRVWGEQNAVTLFSKSKLAFLYLVQARYDEAEPLYVEVLESWRREQGEDIYTLGLMNSLVGLYTMQGRYDEAEALIVKVMEIYRRVGGDEPELAPLHFINNFAEQYRDHRRYDEAEGLLVGALEIGRRVLGAEHPNTLMSIKNLIKLYEAWGKPELAEQWRAKLPREESTQEQ